MVEVHPSVVSFHLAEACDRNCTEEQTNNNNITIIVPCPRPRLIHSLSLSLSLFIYICRYLVSSVSLTSVSRIRALDPWAVADKGHSLLVRACVRAWRASSLRVTSLWRRLRESLYSGRVVCVRPDH
eukprot:GHVU01073074.1.p1 GENE.GHVU01073074.1~~GHVU01073074.1.p1  ORF type:complete len:127 (+),score=0.97 GHVU01073074.1:363-743(+)